MKRAILLILALGCGGQAQNDPVPFGWCCDGLCGLSASESEYFEECSCDGAERAGDGIGRGECIEPLTE
jgi:hypothetical protein